MGTSPSLEQRLEARLIQFLELDSLGMYYRFRLHQKQHDLPPTKATNQLWLVRSCRIGVALLAWQDRTGRSKCRRCSIHHPIILPLSSHCTPQRERLPWQRHTASTSSLLSLSRFLSFRCPSIEKHRSVAPFLCLLAANRSQYFCPAVSCVTCPLYGFPLLAVL